MRFYPSNLFPFSLHAYVVLVGKRRDSEDMLLMGFVADSLLWRRYTRCLDKTPSLLFLYSLCIFLVNSVRRRRFPSPIWHERKSGAVSQTGQEVVEELSIGGPFSHHHNSSFSPSFRKGGKAFFFFCGVRIGQVKDMKQGRKDFCFDMTVLYIRVIPFFFFFFE